MPTASAFVNVADELLSRVRALETELAEMHSGSGESLTLYTSFFTAFNYVPDTILYDNAYCMMTNDNRATR